MKKRVAFFLIIIFILSIVSFLPVTQKTDISLSASFDNIMQQIIHVGNWKNWYPAMREAYKNNPAGYSLAYDPSQKISTINISGKKYIIHAMTPMSYQVREVNSKWVDVFAFTVFSGDTLSRMKISIEKKNPLLFILFDRNKAGENAINGLKSYLEDPKSFYGYKIEMGTIRDSVIASSVFKIRKKDVFLKIHNAYLNLEQYIKTNGLLKTDHVSISYNPISDDSLQITVGVPVNKPAPPDGEINCLLLPAKGNVLVGNYDGRFSDRKKIYITMSKYLTDHTLSVPAESFERYLNDSIPTSDSSMIRIELNYPVY
ncbi:MAG TPA: GyrI-like domain-containing protein [Puia sp.]